ncbi:hypothetical protein TRICHSKD4_5572 [Roseibium sp. TrichSKD4]|uniref:hypothetical protein n=1 Tax=Roseibium sp. TrichSKD4 TaxID=744980 RepID=UPI0001E572DE|nr:hypothetical protein [Roseibium sp. TrichSKD4]EFO29737.1 hypothetical protein TRICHSKD4_5572 [Roseibium sp. TrichSKD4]
MDEKATDFSRFYGLWRIISHPAFLVVTALVIGVFATRYWEIAGLVAGTFLALAAISYFVRNWQFEIMSEVFEGMFRWLDSLLGNDNGPRK